MDISPELSSGMTSGWYEFILPGSWSPFKIHGSLIEFELPVSLERPAETDPTGEIGDCGLTFGEVEIGKEDP